MREKRIYRNATMKVINELQLSRHKSILAKHRSHLYVGGEWV